MIDEIIQRKDQALQVRSRFTSGKENTEAMELYYCSLEEEPEWNEETRKRHAKKICIYFPHEHLDYNDVKVEEFVERLQN